MALGTQTVARLYPNVQLVYRDFVNKNSGEFTYIDYVEFPPYSGILKPTSCIDSICDWEFLNRTDRDAPYSANDEMDFINKLKYKRAL
jgi:hypothetical protein